MTGMLFSARNCCTTSDVWLGASSWCRNHTEQTSHWQVSSSNLWVRSHEWIRERCQRLVPTPRWSFDHIESVVALFQSEEFRELFDCPTYNKGQRYTCTQLKEDSSTEAGLEPTIPTSFILYYLSYVFSPNFTLQSTHHNNSLETSWVQYSYKFGWYNTLLV